MRAVTVVVASEIEELHIQISGRPEQRAVQAFAPNSTDQPFNEWVRERHVQDGLDFFHVENPKIPLPLVEPIQGIMVRTDVCRRSVVARRSIEYSAQPHTVHDTAMHTEAHDATRALVHHHEHPVGAKNERFAPKRSTLHKLSFA